MIGPTELVSTGLETAERSLSLAEKSLSFFERHGFLGISEKRKRRLQTIQQQALEEDARNRSHSRLQTVEETAMTTRVDLLKAVGEAMMNEAKKRLPDLSPTEMASYLQDLGTTLGAITQQAYNEQLAREKIAMIALDHLEQDTCDESKGDEPTDSWMAQFMEYAGKIRDEDVAGLWGKILAGEYKKPGSYSLRTLQILYSLDEKYATMFKNLVKYIIDDNFIPDEVLNRSEINLKNRHILESIGLIVTGLASSKRGVIAGLNKYYCCVDLTPDINLKDLENTAKVYNFSGVILTPYGVEIANILPPSKDEYECGIKLFAEVVNEKYHKQLYILDLEEIKKRGNGIQIWPRS